MPFEGCIPFSLYLLCVIATIFSPFYSSVSFWHQKRAFIQIRFYIYHIISFSKCSRTFLFCSKLPSVITILVSHQPHVLFSPLTLLRNLSSLHVKYSVFLPLRSLRHLPIDIPDRTVSDAFPFAFYTQIGKQLFVYIHLEFFFCTMNPDTSKPQCMCRQH